MKPNFFRAALVGAALATSPALASDADMDALKAEAVGIIQNFGGTLKAELQAAMKDGGPVQAISVCNEAAPAIAASLSEDSGWSVGRSSHKLRNPDNAPNEFTAAAMDEFLAKIAEGEAPENLAKAGIVEEDGQQVFHMVKAIPTAGLCLRCHGSNIEDDVTAKLDELYPEDEARGFSPGDMRGVFTLSKVLD